MERRREKRTILKASTLGNDSFHQLTRIENDKFSIDLELILNLKINIRSKHPFFSRNFSRNLKKNVFPLNVARSWNISSIILGFLERVINRSKKSSSLFRIRDSPLFFTFKVGSTRKLATLWRSPNRSALWIDGIVRNCSNFSKKLSS